MAEQPEASRQPQTEQAPLPDWQQQAIAAGWQQPEWQQQAQAAGWQPPQSAPAQQPATQTAQPAPQQQPQAQTAPAQKGNRNVAILICGIAAIVLSPTIVLGIAAGVVAIVFTLKAQGKAPALPQDGKAKAGFICAIIGVALSIIMIGVSIVAYNNAVKEAQLQAAKTAAEPLYKEIAGEVIADDAVCTMKLTKMEISKEGDLDIHFELTNHAATELTLTGQKGQAWEVNDQKVECVIYTWVKPGQTKEDFFTVPKSYLPTNDINEIVSISGTLEADLDTRVPMEYKVNLFS